jgi:hypothetical protein
VCLQTNIYFYTTKPILPDQELLVWYCREFAERLNYPLSGEQMLQRIRKYNQHKDRGAARRECRSKGFSRAFLRQPRFTLSWPSSEVNDPLAVYYICLCVCVMLALYYSKEWSDDAPR